MKRIILVAPGLSSGGAERVASILANEFYRHGNEVLFVSAYSPKREYPLINGVYYKCLYTEAMSGCERTISRSKQLFHITREFEPDIIISFIFKEMLFTEYFTHFPIIYSLRYDPKVATQKLLNKWIINLSFKRAKSIVFQTKDAREYFNKKIRGKSVVIGNPITDNLPKWKSDCRKRIITACRIVPQKNIMMLIKGFLKFSEYHKDYELEIYGDGPQKSELEQMTVNLNVSDKVHFMGYTKDIHEIMSSSRIFALTSDYEGLSNSMLEALAIGVPTVCTDCPPGGAGEYISSGINGILIRVGDVEQLSKALDDLASDLEFCDSLSKESIRIRELLDKEVIAKEWEKLFD